MSKIDKALRVASRKRKKYARGGDVDDFDPTEGGQIPKSLQFFMKVPPATWTSAPRQRYADGGDTGDVDWSQYNNPFGEVKGTHPSDTPVAFKTADPRANITEGDIDRGINVGMGAGPGIMVGPYGALALRNAARETGNVAAERAQVHPVVEKEFARFGKKLSPEERNLRLAKTQEERDDWALSTLKERAAKGDFSDRDVFAKSGWSFTADGQPAKEISDVGASVKPVVGADNKYSFEHPAGDLHKVYDIPPISTRGFPAHAEAAFRVMPDRSVSIGMRHPGKEDSASVAAHEFQHGISFREGWPRGANDKDIADSLLEREHFPGMELPEYQKKMFMDTDPSLNPSALKGMKSSENTAEIAAYLHSTGENQAHNTGKRLLDPRNYLIYPGDTEAVPRALQDTVYHKAIHGGNRKAGGGGVGGFNPERGEAIGLAHQGAIKSSVPGRTDKLQLNVLGGSSVVPADVVSGLGQSNTDAGHSVLDSMFKKGPYGMNLPKAKAGSRVGARHSSLSFSSKFAGGGETPTTPIVAAGGEYVIPPAAVARLGNGDIDLGHKILNRFYEHVRKKTISQMMKLKPPKNS